MISSRHLWPIIAACLLFLLAESALGQPPVPPDPPPLVIRPQRPGDPIPAKDPPGVIIIRPNGQGAPQTPPATPKTGLPFVRPDAPPVVPKQPVDKANGTPLFEYWFAAAVGGERIGYLHWTGREVEKDGKKLWIGAKYQKFTLDRFGQIVNQFAEESTVETPEGEVLVTSWRQGIGADQALAVTGVVDGKVLKIRGEGGAAGAEDTPWPGGVIGIAREPGLFRDPRKMGESFDYLLYVPQVTRVVKITAKFEGEESATLWANTAPRKLRRFTSSGEPLGKFKMPVMTTWCDAETAEPFRVEFDFPGLGGRVTFLRTTEAAAKAPIAKPLKLFDAQSIRLDREVPGIHAKTSVIYRVTLPGDEEPATAFAIDSRQQIRMLDEKAKTFQLEVFASRGPTTSTMPEAAPGKEFLESNYFINWDNPLVKGHAAAAASGLAPNATWRRAKAVETWVKQNMRAVEFSQAMATADNVARTLSGDCTEYAMLGAAMCRALGIPSRTVLGLVYAPGPGGRPFLAYHMWYEVFAEGQWLPLDATLGMGGIGPGHIKITDHSWHDERSFTPLLPVMRVLMARPAFEVVRVRE